MCIKVKQPLLIVGFSHIQSPYAVIVGNKFICFFHFENQIVNVRKSFSSSKDKILALLKLLHILQSFAKTETRFINGTTMSTSTLNVSG